MNLPCLLDDKMKPRADLHPIRLTVDRSLQPLSMAEMVLPPEDAPVCVRDFVRLCDGFGDDEIYRVSSISEEPGLRRVVQLEHGMATLADDMLPALTYAENVQTILKRILSYQTRIRWRVGDVEADEGVGDFRDWADAVNLRRADELAGHAAPRTSAGRSTRRSCRGSCIYASCRRKFRAKGG